MLLTISTTHQPATDLGFLLHKNPDRHQTVGLSFGVAHVIYPEASPQRCTAALVVDVDPIGLVRDRRGRPGSNFSLAQYVNDRPYVASSFMSVALARVFSTALSGRSKERPEVADREIPLEANLAVVPCRGGESVLRRLFEPLGYTVDASTIPLDTHFPAWGNSRYLAVRLRATTKVKDLLEHLFVLLPVLDDDKHYWVGPDEVDKLLRRGGEWLAGHPDRELIAQRYLRHDRHLAQQAMAHLLADEPVDPDVAVAAHDAEEDTVERRISLGEQRMAAVADALVSAGARRVVDLGCGQGKLIRALLAVPSIDYVVGVDVSHRALEVAARRLHLDTMAPRQRQRVELLQGSLTYRDQRLAGFDAAVLAEVIEHLDPPRLGSFERVVFAHARPGVVVLTTPNVEYNVRFENLPAGDLRHRDHRFEWNRDQLATWSSQVAQRHGYQVDISGIGPTDPEVGSPTQMAVFSR
ncbi:MAG: 3' terminal RNA ribose 2'-O-methyltransferase Hen1 [Acidimicrobiales bacterium]|nr:MAG: 3' terminal RNA ribose 2'-O-methyltransferase Hen1 [Acidimicrobiales bacterium]